MKRQHRCSSPAGALLRACLVSLALLAIGCAPRATLERASHPLLRSQSGANDGAHSARPFFFDDPLPDDDDGARAARAHLAKIAGDAVGRKPIVVAGVRYRMDCSGVASGIYARAGFPVDVSGRAPDTRTLFAIVDEKGSIRRNNPLPGDLVFFDDTYDSNGNGRRDDPLSHVGVVERVEDDGTVVFVHRVGARIIRSRLNVANPHARHDDKGRPLNHYLRAAHGATPARTTGELFVAYGSLPLEPAPVVTSMK